MVAEVVPGGPAAKAGFEQGDIVTAINGKAVEDSRDLTRRVASWCRRRQHATFTVNRQGKTEDHQGRDRRAARRQGRRPTRPTTPSAGARHRQRHGPGPGVADAGSAQDLQPRRQSSTGVVITKVDPDSDAADKGLQPGDVVLKIGNRAVKTPQDVQAGVAEAKKGGRKSVLLLVARPGRHRLCRRRYRQT